VAPTRSLIRLVSFAFACILLFSACGDRFVAPAAVVGGQRISQDTLKNELDEVLLDPQLARQVQGQDGERNRKELTRRLLAFLIEVQLLEQYANSHDISVGSSDIDQALKNTIAGVGGQAAFNQQLKARQLTVQVVRRNLQRQVLFQRVRDSVAAREGLGSNASQDLKGQAFQRWLIGRFRSSGIDVNPRFGRFDPKTGQIVAISSTAT
jgi:SurA-like protein